MSDILNEINKFVVWSNQQNPTPNQFVKMTDKILMQLDLMEQFVNENVTDKKYKSVVLKYVQAMRESAVLSTEVFQNYIDELLKDE